MTNLARHDTTGPIPIAAERPDETLHVVFKVGDADYALAAETVLQMESFTGATPVPGAAPFVAGIVQIRGRIIPVVDLRIRFGAAAAPPTLDTRVVVGQHGDRIVGLLVDSAREVFKIEPSRRKPPPPFLALEGRGFVKAVAQIGPRLVLIVDFARVIGEEPLDVVVE